MSFIEAAITSTFPHASLTLLSADPTYLDFQQLKQELCANAMSQNSPNGGGQHGFLGLVLPNEEYILISNGNIPYVTPICSTNQSHHPTGCNQRHHQRSQQTKQIQPKKLRQEQ